MGQKTRGRNSQVVGKYRDHNPLLYTVIATLYHPFLTFSSPSFTKNYRSVIVIVYPCLD